MKRRRGGGPSGFTRSSGFTLIEVVVTMGVIAIGLALASRLLIESQLGLVRTSAELGNPLPRYALSRLRSDLAQAAPLQPMIPVWRSSPLTLQLASGEQVVWQRTDSEAIERVIVGNPGRPDVHHVVLREVASWQWRPVTDRLIDVDVIYRVRDTSRVPLADVPRSWSPPTVDRIAWLRVGTRAETVP